LVERHITLARQSSGVQPYWTPLFCWLNFDAGTPAPEIDLVIAATAIVHGLIFITHNVRDFAAVPGRMVQDWLAP
jgi:hypothetical protein